MSLDVIPVVKLYGKREFGSTITRNSASNLNKLAMDSSPEPLIKGPVHQHLISDL